MYIVQEAACMHTTCKDIASRIHAASVIKHENCKQILSRHCSILYVRWAPY